MRDYDPTTGRYLQADPLGLVDGASVYGYAMQNPGRYVDPFGLSVNPFYGLDDGPNYEDDLSSCGVQEATLRDFCKDFKDKFKRLGKKEIIIMLFCAFEGKRPPKPAPPPPRPPAVQTDTLPKPKDPPK